MKADLSAYREEQLRQVFEDWGRCHPADAICRERQQLKAEACREADRREREHDALICLRQPGCDWAQECMENARDRSEERVEGCILSKA